MWKVEGRFRIKLGGNTYINVPNLVTCRNETIFKVYRSTSDGLLGIDFDIYDQNKQKVATVSKGRIYSGQKENYEVRMENDHYSVTEKTSGRIICDIRRRSQAPDAELEISVELFTPDGILFRATPNETNLGAVTIKDCVFQDSDTGISIG